MKDLTTEEFCSKFRACKEGANFARKYKMMRECYDALLRGDAGEASYEWAVWVITCEGVMPESALQLFAVKCARSVQHLVTNESITRALYAAERYANGEANRDDLTTAKLSARAAAFAAQSAAFAADLEAGGMSTAVFASARLAVDAAKWAEKCVEMKGERAKRKDACYPLFSILAELGNPFEEVEE